MATDITEIKLLQNQLRESRERYRHLFEEVPCYITIQDRDLRIVEANRRFREDFGESVGQQVPPGLHAPDRTVRPLRGEGNVSGRTGPSDRGSGDLAERRADERPRLHGSHPQCRGTDQNVIEMSTNITPIRQLQSQLASLGLVISSISHGIKGLLTSLDGGIYLVNSGLEKNNRDAVRNRAGRWWSGTSPGSGRMVLDLLYYAKDRVPELERIPAANGGGRGLRGDAGEGGEMGIEFQSEFDPRPGISTADCQGRPFPPGQPGGKCPGRLPGGLEEERPSGADRHQGLAGCRRV